MKHLEVRQKYSAARHIFDSLLSVSSGDETLRLMFDILLEKWVRILWNLNAIISTASNVGELSWSYIAKNQFNIKNWISKFIKRKRKSSSFAYVLHKTRNFTS